MARKRSEFVRRTLRQVLDAEVERHMADAYVRQPDNPERDVIDGDEDFRAAVWLAYEDGRDGAYTCSDMKFTRITVRPDVCTGKPCIRDLRFPVSRLLGLLAARQTPDEILRAYPYLEAADIDEALRYAASLAEDETIELVG